jgi:hypothetical protein
MRSRFLGRRRGIRGVPVSCAPAVYHTPWRAGGALGAKKSAVRRKERTRVARSNLNVRERARELRRLETPVEQMLWAALRDRRFRGLNSAASMLLDRLSQIFTARRISWSLKSTVRSTMQLTRKFTTSLVMPGCGPTMFECIVFQVTASGMIPAESWRISLQCWKRSVLWAGPLSRDAPASVSRKQPPHHARQDRSMSMAINGTRPLSRARERG